MFLLPHLHSCQTACKKIQPYLKLQRSLSKFLISPLFIPSAGNTYVHETKFVNLATCSTS